MPPKETLATRLKDLLAQQKLTIVEAAKKARIPKTTLHNWTLGTTPTDFEMLERLAEILNTDLNFLLLGKITTPVGKNKHATVDALFTKGGVLFDGFAHIKVTRLLPRESLVITRENVEGEDDD